MIGILVMLNNYFHDFAAGIVFVSGVTLFQLVNRAVEHNTKAAREIVVGVYPTLVHIIGGAIIFMLFAGVIRTFTYKEFEWHNALEIGQLYAIYVKHAVLGGLFFYGVYQWFIAHKKMKLIKEQLKNE